MVEANNKEYYEKQPFGALCRGIPVIELRGQNFDNLGGTA